MVIICFFNFDPDGRQPITSTHGVGIYSIFQKEYLSLNIISQAPTFRNTFGYQYRSKVVIIYSLGVPIEAHLLSY